MMVHTRTSQIFKKTFFYLFIHKGKNKTVQRATNTLVSRTKTEKNDSELTCKKTLISSKYLLSQRV